jgi:murein DD-endopeptidase MepM/ murein hydrolase activator NlpD
MSNVTSKNNVAAGGKFRNLFRPRDFFFHDGRALRRLKVGTGVQVSGALTALALFGWSVFSATQLAQPDPTSEELARMEQKVQAMEASVEAIEEVARQRYDITAQEMKRLGLDPKRFAGTGGPFEAVQPLKTADPSFKQLFMSWKKLDRLEHGTIAIPSTQPVKGTSLTSGYGVRSDPFRGRAAMHAGIDLAAPIGTPIYATADAVVERSEWANGYGNLVELNHGRGIQTRYGHLSKSLVRAGQRVKRGDLIAHMGSTGRSTGSHLHYEVRIDGKAVNPIPFMQSNDILLAVQRRAAAATRVAMGGPSEAAK